MTRWAGILLAGGASRRFGRDKLVEKVAGAPLFTHPLRALLATCEEVVIVLAPEGPEPRIEDPTRVRFVRDDVAFAGPLAGCRAGLEAVRSEIAIVAAGDMPHLGTPLIELIGARAAKGSAAVVLADGETARPLPLALDVSAALPAARGLLASGERRLRALVAALAAEVVPLEVWSAVDPTGEWRRDVDVPEDLSARGLPLG